VYGYKGIIKRSITIELDDAIEYYNLQSQLLIADTLLFKKIIKR